MTDNLDKKASRTANQAKWWKYTAWTLPFSALAFIAFAYFIGLDGWYSQAIVITVTFFFTASVLWWWWALHKIVDIMKGIEVTANRLQSIKNHIQEFKNIFKDDNDSDRKRRE
jgi:hypothetical protein